MPYCYDNNSGSNDLQNFREIIGLLYFTLWRMKHTGDYELDEINMLEQECADLEEENRKLKKDLEFVYGWKDQLEKENKNLKEIIEHYKNFEK